MMIHVLHSGSGNKQCEHISIATEDQQPKEADIE
jgi:hypothetical protein